MVTLGKQQGDRYIQGDHYIQVNFSENIEETEKLFNERNIQGDRYLQARYIQVWLYRICIPVYKVF